MPPSLESDELLGDCYLDPAEFQKRARAFGALSAIKNWDPETEIKPLIASASRLVDQFTGRTFSLDAVTENHDWDSTHRRTFPNMPPVASLISYVIRTSPSQVATFDVTPVTVDAGGRNVHFGDVYYNYQANYIELASLKAAGTLTPTLITLGITTPEVEITYTSWATVPQSVQAAVGYIAAQVALESQANQAIAPGLGSIETPKGLKLSRKRSMSATDEDAIPPIAKRLLQKYRRYAIA